MVEKASLSSYEGVKGGSEPMPPVFTSSLLLKLLVSCDSNCLFPQNYPMDSDVHDRLKIRQAGKVKYIQHAALPLEIQVMVKSIHDAPTT